MENSIRLKAKGINFSVEVEGNISADKLKELRKLLEVIVSEDVADFDAYIEDELDYSLMEISPDLKRKNEFRSIAKELIYSEEEHLIKKITIKNIIKIKLNKSEKKVETNLNKDEWLSQISDVFSEVSKKNVSYGILHIITSVDEGEIDFLKDSFRKYLFFTPLKIFLTKKESLTKTNVEMILFGNDLLGTEADE
jgi:hypothetical protein